MLGSVDFMDGLNRTAFHMARLIRIDLGPSNNDQRRMTAFLSSNIFNTYLLPLVFVSLGILTNLLGKKDGAEHRFSNDLAVGSTVFLLCISTVFADIHAVRQSNSSQNFEDFFAWLMWFLILMLASLVNDRFNSWVKDGKGKKLEQKHWLWGITVPVALSFLFFVLYKWDVTP